jgi:uncharacterized protein
MVEKSKNPYAIPVILMVFVFIVFSFFNIFYPMIKSRSVYLTIGGGVFNARLATTESERSKGLSGVRELKPNEALLMAFPYESNWSVWMKDMKIPIDVIWLDSQGKVLYIVTDISPDNSDNVIFTPNSDLVKYILEIPAGKVKESSINEKSMASFVIDETIVAR